jgi:peptide/nickel transport system permease protein
MFLFVVTLNFVLFRLMPGDPLTMVSKEVASSVEGRATLERLYGLDKPILQQYVSYLKSMITFDFGMSFHYKQPVINIIGDKIKNSLILGVAAVPFGIAIGIIGGIVAAARHGKKTDMIITTSSMVIYAIPTFWMAMILLMLFGVKLGWVPINSMVTPGANFASNTAYLKDLLHHLIIPVISYAVAIFGSYLLIMRGAMIDVFTEDYVLTARAKGLKEKQVIMKHVVPNALLPISTTVIYSLAIIFTGAFAIEVLFSWPGMGKLMVESVNRRDYPIMQASNYLIAVAVILANFIMDIVYGYLDPRIRLG